MIILEICRYQFDTVEESLMVSPGSGSGKETPQAKRMLAFWLKSSPVDNLEGQD